jgi:PAS domain-containing protein
LPLERALSRGELVCGEEFQARCADGPPIPLVANAAPLRTSQGEVVGDVITLDDSTGAKRSEEERRQAKRFRDLFNSILGHDLRNPLPLHVGTSRCTVDDTRKARYRSSCREGPGSGLDSRHLHLLRHQFTLDLLTERFGLET